jgi:hypothetical protein
MTLGQIGGTYRIREVDNFVGNPEQKKLSQSWIYSCGGPEGIKTLRPLSVSTNICYGMLGTWARIALKAWMCACVYSVFVLSCVGSGLASG